MSTNQRASPTVALLVRARCGLSQESKSHRTFGIELRSVLTIFRVMVRPHMENSKSDSNACFEKSSPFRRSSSRFLLPWSGEIVVALLM